MEDLKSKNIAIIGPVFQPFLETVEKSEHTATHYAHFTELPASSYSNLDAVVVDARHEGFPTAQEITALLKSGIAICVFSPTAASINAIQAATGTKQNLSQYSYDDGVPLIIHSQNDGSVRFIPGFETKIPNQDKGNSGLSLGAIKGAKALQLTTLPLNIIVFQGQPANDTLSPPSDTNFIHHESITFNVEYHCEDRPWDKKNGWSIYDINTYQAFELQWTLGFYIYAAERRPYDADFSTNGTVWTVIKHSGYFKRKGANGARYFHHGVDGNSESSYFFVDRLKFSIKDESGLMTINKIYPESTSRQGTEDAIQHSIDFTLGINLYKDNGENSFLWNPKWADSYTHDQFSQYGEKSKNEATIYIDYDKFYNRRQNGLDDKSWAKVDDSKSGIFYTDVRDTIRVRKFPKDYINIHGLTVFESKLGTPSLRLQFEPEVIAFKSKTAWGTGTASYGILTFDKELGKVANVDLTFSEDVKAYRNSQKSDGETKEEASTPPAYAKETGKAWVRHSIAGEFKTA